MNLKKFKIREFIKLIENHPWIILIAATLVILFLFRELFHSYFTADEWFHFTYYLPLTRKPDGFLTAFISTIVDTGLLSGGGQHITPIATEIFFLNTKFFGLNFVPYAFMSLLFHAVNSFLIFLLIRTLLYKKETLSKNVFGILGAVFFALAPTPSHAVTGAAAFYSSNVLSVTFFLLCLISFKTAYIKGEKKFMYFSFLLLFGALFTKETTAFLFLLLPFMVLIEKRIFPLKLLGKLFVFCIFIYAIFRFLVPNVYQGVGPLVGPLVDKLVENYVLSSLPSWQRQSRQEIMASDTGTSDTGTIVSRDLSIHKNLPGEILFRGVTFPVKMTGTLFLPRQTVFSIVDFITPILQPVPPGGDSAEQSQVRLRFLYGAGNAFIIYLGSIIILIFCLRQIFRFIEQKQIKDAQALSTGLAIIILGALPLVAIIFSFPRWGYDFYFDSRHYYNPNVGAAIVFPFLLFGLTKVISSLFKIRKSSFVVALLFIAWLAFDLNLLNYNFNAEVNRYASDSRELVRQLKKYLPTLPKNVVIYAETDGLSAYGPSLPFQTSVPQALTVVYYDKSPLPDSFFEKPLFDGKGEGYQYSEGQGFGYYTSKKKLSGALIAGKFKPSDVYAFYYMAEEVLLSDITSKFRPEMEEYLLSAKENSGWEVFSDPSINLSFLYPPQTITTQSPNSIRFEGPSFIADLVFIDISSGFDINEYIKIRRAGSSNEILSKKVSFDKFHYNDVVVIIGQSKREYFVKLNDKLIKLETYNIDSESLLIIEKILGSIELIEQK